MVHWSHSVSSVLLLDSLIQVISDAPTLSVTPSLSASHRSRRRRSRRSISEASYHSTIFFERFLCDPLFFERRIKDNQYEFPDDKPISDEARELITGILTVDPRTFFGLLSSPSLEKADQTNLASRLHQGNALPFKPSSTTHSFVRVRSPPLCPSPFPTAPQTFSTSRLPNRRTISLGQERARLSLGRSRIAGSGSAWGRV